MHLYLCIKGDRTISKWASLYIANPTWQPESQQPPPPPSWHREFGFKVDSVSASKVGKILFSPLTKHNEFGF